MPWENLKLETQREQLIKSYIAKEFTMKDLCNKFGISRKTAYKWYRRYSEKGIEGLKDEPRTPHNPNKIYSKDIIDKAIDYKLKHRTWGPKKILKNLSSFYPEEDWPSPTWLYEIFKEYHLVTPRKIRSRVPATAPLGHLSECNDTWSVDLKGWFFTADKSKCEPLTITDCVSRYLIKCIHLNRHTVDYVWPVFDEAFREYGLPKHIRSDNGSPFGSTGIGRLTRLSVKLIKAGVLPEWINPGCPEENGRHERFHLTLKQDTANPPKATLNLQIKAMHDFQYEYNNLRPHEALDMKTPANCYYKSPRAWNGILRSPEYDTKEIVVRKVQANGVISFQNKVQFIGEALIGEYIGLKPTIEDNFEIYFGPLYLGQLTRKGVEKPRNNRKK